MNACVINSTWRENENPVNFSKANWPKIAYCLMNKKDAFRPRTYDARKTNILIPEGRIPERMHQWNVHEPYKNGQRFTYLHTLYGTFWNNPNGLEKQTTSVCNVNDQIQFVSNTNRIQNELFCGSLTFL